MPTSEPAKKAAKKATKKSPAKTAAKKKRAAIRAATEVALGPAGEEVLGGVTEEVNEIVARAREAGVPALLGAATVTLHLEIADATTPVNAVNQVLTELALNGLRGYTWLVRDEITQELFAVTDGTMVSMEEARIEEEPDGEA